MEMLHEILNEGETWVALGFVLVLALLWWKGVPGMVAKMLDQRAAVISAELDEARKLRAEAAALLEDYKKRAATAEAEAAGIVQAAKADVDAARHAPLVDSSPFELGDMDTVVFRCGARRSWHRAIRAGA